MSKNSTSEDRVGVALAAGAVLFLSTSPVFTRWASQSLSSYEITTWRLLLAGVVVLGLALIQKQSLPVRADWLKFAGFGLITALHFLFYNASLEFTTIAHSLAIVYTAPIFVAIFSWLFLGEALTMRKWLGTLIVVAGVVVLAGMEPNLTRRMLWGDLLALGCAITFGLYSVAGRSQRENYRLFAYAGSVYFLAGLWMIPVTAFFFRPLGYTPVAIGSLVWLAVLPLAVGHTLYNAALRKTSATLVNLIATQEITGGILLGIFLLGEIPSFSSVIGVIITLLGIGLLL